MKELSLNILDIVQNSISAKAKNISVSVDSSDSFITFTVKDNGCGMSSELLKSVIDPFTTTRTTRRIGLGIPLLKEAAEQTGGNIEIISEVGKGTTLTARFVKDNIDCPPVGDTPSAVSLIIQSMDDDCELSYRRITDKGMFEMSTKEIKQILGEGISLREPEIILWIQDYIRENEACIL